MLKSLNGFVSAAVSIAVILQLSCTFHQSPRSGNGPEHFLTRADAKSVKEVVLTLDQFAPSSPWSASDDEVADPERHRRALQYLERLNRYSTPALREGIIQFEEKQKAAKVHDVLGLWWKLFIVNRFIFNVPESVNAGDAPQFGGWLGIPQSNGKVNVLWPLEKAADNQLVLVGTRVGYLGPDFVAIREFDYFNEKYGRRLVPANDYP